jgi:hypothetical protein
MRVIHNAVHVRQRLRHPSDAGSLYYFVLLNVLIPKLTMGTVLSTFHPPIVLTTYFRERNANLRGLIPIGLFCIIIVSSIQLFSKSWIDFTNPVIFINLYKLRYVK